MVRKREKNETHAEGHEVGQGCSSLSVPGLGQGEGAATVKAPGVRITEITHSPSWRVPACPPAQAQRDGRAPEKQSMSQFSAKTHCLQWPTYRSKLSISQQMTKRK